MGLEREFRAENEYQGCDDSVQRTFLLGPFNDHLIVAALHSLT